MSHVTIFRLKIGRAEALLIKNSLFTPAWMCFITIDDDASRTFTGNYHAEQMRLSSYSGFCCVLWKIRALVYDDK